MSDDSTEWIEDWPEPPAPAGRRRLVAAVVVLIFVVGGGAFFFVRTRTDGSPSTDAGPSDDSPGTTSHLLVAIEGEGEALPAIALVANTKQGTSVVYVPATTQVEVPGVGSKTLAEALTQTGPEGLAVSLANALGIKTPRAIVAASSVGAQTVDAIGGVRVDVPEDVVVREADEDRTLFARGGTQMDGNRFVRYLTASFPSQLELDRIVRQKAGWRAFLRTFKGAEKPPLLGWRGDIDEAAAAAVLRDTSESPRETSLAVKRQGFTGADTYTVDENELGPLRTALRDFVVVTTEKGRRVRLLMGSNDPVGPKVGRVLVDAGYVIVFTDKASRTYESTEIVVAKDLADAEAVGDKIVKLLGTGTVAVTNRQSSVLDIIVVVGSDWARTNGSPPR